MDERPFETLHTMHDYYDGPRRGVADYDGRPCSYCSLFLDYDSPPQRDVFELRAVDEEAFALDREQWQIWLRWRAAFDVGDTTIDTHPALPHERARYDEVAARLTDRLWSGPVLARAHLEVRVTAESPAGTCDGPDLQVQWHPVEP